MKDHIVIDYVMNENAIGQAAFIAQQYYNNNNMGQRIVKRAVFVPGGLDVEYDEPECKKPDGGFTDIITVKPEGEQKTTGQGPLMCPKCGREYTNDGRGRRFYKKHVAKCDGKNK